MNTKKIILIAMVSALGLYFLLMGLQWFFDNYKFRFQYPLRTPIWIESIKKLTVPPIKRVILTSKVISTPTPIPIKKTSILPLKKFLTEQGAKNREKALIYLSKYYNGDELIAADNILKKEAGYRTDAINEIGACGITQAYPCQKMPCSLNEDGLECQLQWFVGYINTHGYGSPSVAWDFHLKNNFY